MQTNNAPELPTLNLIDVLGDQGFKSILTTMDVHSPCWLLAGTITETDGDLKSWKFVYRSAALRDTDSEYQRAAEFIGDAPIIGEPQTIEDGSMMFAKAELSLYEVTR